MIGVESKGKIMFTYVLYNSAKTGEMICCLKVYTNLNKSSGVNYNISESKVNNGNIRVYQGIV